MSPVTELLHDPPQTTRRLLSAPVSTVAFWLAIAFPLAYLPFLVGGIDSTGGLVWFVALVGLHLAALLAGRSHRDPSP